MAAEDRMVDRTTDLREARMAGLQLGIALEEMWLRLLY
jgi:hypothetical protein